MRLRNRRTLMALLAVLLLAITAVALYGFRSTPDQEPELSAEQIERLGQSSAAPPAQPGTGNSAAPVASSAPRDTVVKFVLAAANPSRPAPSESDKQAALGVLSEELKTKAAGQPQSLLGIPQPSSFQVGEAALQRDRAAMGIVFKFGGSADVRFDVTLDQRGDGWVITGLTRTNSRQG